METNRYIDILPITSPTGSVDLFYEDKGNVYIDKQNSRFYIDQTGDRYITISHDSEKESFLIDCGKPVMQGFTFTKELYERFVHYFNSVIYPTLSLVELVKNDYVSEEENRFNISMRNAQKTLRDSKAFGKDIKNSFGDCCVSCDFISYSFGLDW